MLSFNNPNLIILTIILFLNYQIIENANFFLIKNAKGSLVNLISGLSSVVKSDNQSFGNSMHLAHLMYLTCGLVQINDCMQQLLQDAISICSFCVSPVKKNPQKKKSKPNLPTSNKSIYRTSCFLPVFILPPHKASQFRRSFQPI